MSAEGPPMSTVIMLRLPHHSPSDFPPITPPAGPDINIVTACLVIGGVTTVVATIGVLIGKHVGAYLGRYAEVAGGLTLIGIGSLILYTHLTA